MTTSQQHQQQQPMEEDTDSAAAAMDVVSTGPVTDDAPPQEEETATAPHQQPNNRLSPTDYSDGDADSAPPKTVCMTMTSAAAAVRDSGSAADTDSASATALNSDTEQQQLQQLQQGQPHEAAQAAGTENGVPAAATQQLSADAAKLKGIDRNLLTPGHDPAFLVYRPSAQFVIDWLHQNFQLADGMNLPREQVYQEYHDYAQSHKFVPLNAATFGKLMRSTFQVVATRRLGVRGQSKYHYHGIKVRAGSYLADHPEMECFVKAMPPGVKSKPLRKIKAAGSGSSGSGGSGNSATYRPLPDKYAVTMKATFNTTGSDPAAHDPHKGRLNTLFVPEMPEVNESAMDPGVSLQQFHEFVAMYKNHLGDLVCALNLTNVHHIPDLMHSFWRLLLDELLPMLGGAYVSKYIGDCDIYFYSMILNFCYAESLMAWGNTTLDQYEAMMNNFDKWTAASVSVLPDSTRNVKVTVATAFAHSLKRVLHLQLVASRMRPILGSDAVLGRLINDWKKLDFMAVNEYVCWAAQWQDGFIDAVETDILAMLRKKATLQNWTTWLNSLIQRSINFPMIHENYDMVAVEFYAKQFVTKFALFTTQLMRDLTLRGVSTFASWQTFRLFIDEYIWYTTTKNLALLKLNYYGKMGMLRYPDWINGTLYFHLEQSHYFGVAYAQDISRPMSRAQSVPSLPRLPSNADIVNLPLLSRDQSFEHVADVKPSFHQDQSAGTSGHANSAYHAGAASAGSGGTDGGGKPQHGGYPMAATFGGKSQYHTAETSSLSQILNYQQPAYPAP